MEQTPCPGWLTLQLSKHACQGSRFPEKGKAWERPLQTAEQCDALDTLTIRLSVCMYIYV